MFTSRNESVRPMLRTLAIVCGVLLASTGVNAQRAANRGTVLKNAPIFVVPDASRTPLRVAAAGTVLEILGTEGGWANVRFHDPQLGPRVGYIELRFLQGNVDADLRPMDLSVPRGPVAPANAAPQPGVEASPARDSQTMSTNVSRAFLLRDSTPVRMRINRTVSSESSKVGETVDFEVLDDVLVNEVVVIKRGATAIATVTQAQSKRRMGRAGKLGVNIDYVRLVNDQRAALRAVKDVEGGGHTGAMTGAIVATSIVFFPAAPLFLFMHGKDITIPKGTEVTAYVNGDITLDPTAPGWRP